jgi:hypothetical protein
MIIIITTIVIIKITIKEENFVKREKIEYAR